MSVGLLEKLTQARGRVSLVGLLTVLTATVALVFGIIAITARSRTIPAEIASGWGLAFVTSASAWSVATNKSRAKRRKAYNRFLTSSDSLVADHDRLRDAEADFEAASRKFDDAQEKHRLVGNAANERVAIEANLKLSVAQESLRSVRTAVDKLQEEYDAAKRSAGELVPDSVRSAFEEFGICPPQCTPARDLARSAFVKAARRDLRLRVREDESTL